MTRFDNESEYVMRNSALKVMTTMLEQPAFLIRKHYIPKVNFKKKSNIVN